MNNKASIRIQSLVLMVSFLFQLSCGSGVPGGGTFDAPGVDVSNQRLNDASVVIVDQVYSDGPGWLVIRSSIDSGGTLKPSGEVMGRVAIPDGLSTRVSVSLSRAVTDNQFYFAMLHRDLPPVSVYDNAEDLQARDSTGTPIQQLFLVTLSEIALKPAIKGEFQVSLKSQVAIGSVSVSEDSWLVLRQRQVSGLSSKILGYEPVSRGVHSMILVDLFQNIGVAGAQIPFVMTSTPTYNLSATLVKDSNGAPDLSSAGGLGVTKFGSVKFDIAGPFKNSIADVRITIRDTPEQQYEVIDVEPAYYANLVQKGGRNSDIGMIRDLRYEFVLVGNQAHPIEFLYDPLNGTFPGLDDGYPEDVFFTTRKLDAGEASKYPDMFQDPGADWVGNVSLDYTIDQRGRAIRFTFYNSTSIYWPSSIMNTYRCSNHPESMRGRIVPMHASEYVPPAL